MLCYQSRTLLPLLLLQHQFSSHRLLLSASAAASRILLSSTAAASSSSAVAFSTRTPKSTNSTGTKKVDVPLADGEALSSAQTASGKGRPVKVQPQPQPKDDVKAQKSSDAKKATKEESKSSTTPTKVRRIRRVVKKEASEDDLVKESEKTTEKATATADTKSNESTPAVATKSSSKKGAKKKGTQQETEQGKPAEAEATKPVDEFGIDVASKSHEHAPKSSQASASPSNTSLSAPTPASSSPSSSPSSSSSLRPFPNRSVDGQLDPVTLRRVLLERTQLWEMHRARSYTEFIRQFEALKSRPNDNIVTQDHHVVYQYLHSLAQLNRYIDIINFYMQTPQSRKLVTRHVESLNLLMNACLREPQIAPTRLIFASLKMSDQQTIEKRRTNEARQKVHNATGIATPASSSSSPSSSSSSSSPSPTSPSPNTLPFGATPNLQLSEKVANQILKSFLLNGEPQLAYSAWRHIWLGEIDTVTSHSKRTPQYHHPSSPPVELFTATPPVPNASPYVELGYRLQPQAADGLIAYMLKLHEESQASKTNDSTPRIFRSRHFPSTLPNDINSDYIYLTHAHKMYTHTSFIEQTQHEPALLIRVLKAAIDKLNHKEKGGAKH